jgi:hypothetical protein
VGCNSKFQIPIARLQLFTIQELPQGLGFCLFWRRVRDYSVIPVGEASKQTKACCFPLRSKQQAFLRNRPFETHAELRFKVASAKKPDFAMQNQAFVCFGGELGIRTPGPVTDNSFQDCRNRPLCQLSICENRHLSVFCQI